MGNWSERWTQPNYRKGADAWTARRVLQVFDVGSPDEALSTIENWVSIRGDEPVKHNSKYPYNELLLCNDRAPQATGLRSYDVTCSYSTTPMGVFPNPGTPLLDPTYWQWEDCATTEAVDRDAYGNPIVNSAGNPFPLGAAQRRINFLTFYARRNEPAYNPQTWLTYGNRVNSRQMRILNWTVEPGQVLLASYKQLAETTTHSLFVPVRYTFQLMGPAPTTTSADASDGLWDSFKYRVLDQGFNGWYNASGGPRRGKIVYARVDGGKGEQPPTETLLDGEGRPIDDTYNISPGPGIGFPDVGAVVNPAGLPDDVQIEPAADGRAVFLKYTLYPGVDFMELGL